LWFGRNQHQLASYFLANKQLSAGLLAFSFAASWFGATSTKGALDAYYSQGLSGLWLIALPSVASLLLVCCCFGKRVSRLTSLSQPQAVEEAYGGLGRLVLTITLLVASTTTLASQLVALGSLLQAFVPTLAQAQQATAMVAFAIALYTLIGGFVTVVATDVLQMVVLVGGLGFLAVWLALQALAQPQALQAVWVSKPASFWQLSAHWGESLALLVAFSTAWSIAPEMWQRMKAAATPKAAQRAALGATLCLVGLSALVFGIGWLSPVVLGGSLNPNNPGQPNVLVALAQALPNPLLGSLVLLAFLAAVGSTMDSVLNTGALTATYDLYYRYLHPKASPQRLITISRWVTLLLPLPALWIAFRQASLIKTLWLSADIYACTLFVPIVALLYAQRPQRQAGQAAMVVGGLWALCSALVQNDLAPALAPFWPPWPHSTVWGLGLSTLVYAGVAAGGALQRQVPLWHYAPPHQGRAVWGYALLAPLSWVYGWGVGVHQALYRFGLKRSLRVPFPVVSVGNLTAGGTGKTPVTLAVVKALQALPLPVAVLSRGYGARLKPVGGLAKATLPALGDEAHWLQSQLPHSWVVVGKNRAANAQKLGRSLPALGAVVLDDGHQHAPLAKTVALVLVEATRGFGNGQLLPQGPLREPVPAGLARAHGVLLTKVVGTQAEVDEQVAAWQQRLGQEGYSGPVWPVAIAHTHLEALFDANVTLPLEALQGQAVVLLSTLANPHAFEAQVQALGATVHHHAALADHALLKPALLQKGPMAQALQPPQGQALPWLLCTTKEAAKLKAALGEDLPQNPVYVLQQEAKLPASLVAWLHQQVQPEATP
jgi:SSS family solute:Na+ symporter